MTLPLLKAQLHINADHSQSRFISCAERGKGEKLGYDHAIKDGFIMHMHGGAA